MGIILNFEGFADAQDRARQLDAHVTEANTRALQRIGYIAHREAVKNAPISPSVGLLNKLRKFGPLQKKRRKRKDRATSRPKPGGLEQSIAFTSDKDRAIVYVPANSTAGKYAFRIHEEKGVSWNYRGLGTIAKGPRADAKFIERAVFENADNFRQIMVEEHSRM